MATVSVVMPAYNVAPYLGAAIESVLDQTFTDLELFVVDDGSTDATPDIAAAWAGRDPRVRVLQKPNGGISSARNHALRAASGAVIAILDSDDMWSPTFLATQMRIFDRQPEIDIVTGNAWLLYGQGGPPSPAQVPHAPRSARPVPDSRPAPDLTQILTDETAVFIMSIVRYRVYQTIGGFDESLRTNEDYDFWLRAAAAGFRFYRNDEPLGYYRQRDDSLSASELRMVRGILRVYQKLRPQLIERPADLAILDSQVARFESERLAGEARQAIETGDLPAAADALAALHRRRGGVVLGVAHLMARWAPGLLSKAYGIRRARLGAARHHEAG
jgi:glycosyltransferase involved in cell wall biosynthesis